MMICKYFICSTALSSILCVAFAVRAEGEHHVSGKPRFTFGATTGAILATQDTAAPFGANIDAGRKVGLVLGVAAAIGLYSSSLEDSGFFIAAHPELLYASKGTNLDRDGDTLGAYHVGYIGIPLLVQVGIHINSRLAPYLLVGPELGLLLTAEVENSRGEIADTKENFKTIDLGLVFGGGIALDVASLNGSLSIEARYDLGLTDINDTGTGGFVKNRALFVMLGYQYVAM